MSWDLDGKTMIDNSHAHWIVSKFLANFAMSKLLYEGLGSWQS